MLDSLFNPLTFPPFDSVSHLEGKGNYAVDRYYKYPYRYFYRHKVRMIVSLMNRKYHNILDFGSGGANILNRELSKHASFIKNVDVSDVIDPRWKFDLILFSSVLEFVPTVSYQIRLAQGMLKPNGTIIVASPMTTFLTKGYFNLIKDTHNRRHHKDIISSIRKYFVIERYKEWLGLYFSLRARPK